MKILLVDDEASLVELLAGFLRGAGHEVVGLTSGVEAVKALETVRFDVVITDLVMKPAGGMDVLQAARDAGRDTDVVVITAHGTIDVAVEAMRQGAADFIAKPFSGRELAARLDLLAERRRLRSENAALKDELAATGRFGELVGSSPELARVRSLISRVAPGDTTVLILGESGTGKELVARMIHRESRRATRPFIPVHAAALPETLLESELFGHERGAFTGAVRAKPGRLEAAAGGTLFLDEIGELGPAFQVKLLRFLQEKTFVRLGGSTDIPVDARIVAATNRNLREAIAEGTFREDLYYRLAVFPIELPPLRQRPGDIEELCRHILRRNGYNAGPGPDVLELLRSYDWPGNVRELENVLERALILAAGGEIRPSHIQLPEPVLARPQPGNSSLSEMERTMIEDALAKAGGNKTRAAKLLGITRRMLYTKLARYGIAANDEP